MDAPGAAWAPSLPPPLPLPPPPLAAVISTHPQYTRTRTSHPPFNHQRSTLNLVMCRSLLLASCRASTAVTIPLPEGFQERGLTQAGAPESPEHFLPRTSQLVAPRSSSTLPFEAHLATSNLSTAAGFVCSSLLIGLQRAGACGTTGLQRRVWMQTSARPTRALAPGAGRSTRRSSRRQPPPRPATLAPCGFDSHCAFTTLKGSL